MVHPPPKTPFFTAVIRYFYVNLAEKSGGNQAAAGPVALPEAPARFLGGVLNMRIFKPRRLGARLELMTLEE